MSSKKELGYDRDGIRKVMRKRDYFGDATGQIGLGIMGILVGQMAYFYTDKVGIAAGLVGIILLISKVLDAFTDIIAGHLLDKSKLSKDKKYTAWLGRLIIPAGIATILMFTIPSSLGQGVSGVYVLLTNVLLIGVIFTAISTPYAALQVVRTQSQEERGVMGTFRAMGGYLPGMVITIAIIPVTNLLGGDQAAWIKFGVIASAFLILFLSICYFSTRKAEWSDETVENEHIQHDKKSLKINLGRLFRNKYWVMVLIVNLFIQIIFTLNTMSGVYYARWIFGNDNLMAILGGIGLIPTIIGFMLVGPMLKRFGVMNTLRFSALLGMVGLIIRLFSQTSFSLFIVTSALVTLASIPIMSLMGVMSAMAIDYNDYLYRDKIVALSSGAISFGNKVGGGLASMILTGILALASYDPTMETVTTGVRYAIYTFTNYVPLVAFAFMLFFLIKFDLEKRLPNIRQEIANRSERDANGKGSQSIS